MRIELTTPDGRRFEVNPDKIDILEEAQRNVVSSYPANVRAIIYVDGHMQEVCETVEHIKQMEMAVNEQEALHHLHQPT
jgi:hypothetical protein